MTDLERRLAELNGLDPSELEPHDRKQEKIDELNAMLDALLRGETDGEE